MKTKHVLLAVLFLGALFAGSTAMAQVTFATAPSSEYNVFYVADLGLQGSGGRNRVFELNVNLGAGQAVSITVRHNGQDIMTGQTDPLPSAVNDTFWNFEIDDRFGGNFEVLDEGNTVDKILATGLAPAGTYEIVVNNDSASFIVNPPFLQPVFPVDMAVPETALDFKYVARNFSGSGNVLTLRVFEDPRGRSEITRGEILPAVSTGGLAPGTAISKLLEEGNTYYWQLSGLVRTTHGDELLEGPVSMFVYGAPFNLLGLSDEDKQDIKDKLIEILQQYVNNRAARSIADYIVNRGVLDNSVVGREEIMTLLLLVEEGAVEINSISLQ
jgi:hypothetical protein